MTNLPIEEWWAVLIVATLIQGIKTFWIPTEQKKFLPFIAILLWVLYKVITDPVTEKAIVEGIVVGTTAIGSYETIKSMGNKQSLADKQEYNG